MRGEMSSSRLRVSIFIAGLAVFAESAASAPVPSFSAGLPVTVGIDATTKYYDFKSAINDRTYRIFVSIPNGTPPKDGFPVIYLLDGNRNFATASDDLKLAVVVGIGYPTNHYAKMLSERTKDLTTPISVDRLKILKQHYYGGYNQSPDAIGGMDDFLRVIEHEIKPFIGRLAPINVNEQALFGHSLGGLTVVHALFTEPTAFQTFIASSPSIWWDEKAVLRDEPSFAREVTTGRAEPRILIDVGSLEQYAEGLTPGTTAAAAREAQMVSNAVNLGKQLAKLKGRPPYMVKTVVFADETHLTVTPAAIIRGLGFAFGTGSLLTPKTPNGVAK